MCQQCPHGVPCPFRSFLSDQWRQPDFEDRKQAQQKLPRWLQRMEIHAQHVHISVQLLASLLHFIIASVSALTVSAVQIQVMDRLNKGWSLHTMYICTFFAWKVCGSVLVWNTCTACIFLRRLHRSKYEQPIRWMDYWWSLKERAFKTYTVFCTLHAYLRSAHVCAWIILCNILRCTCLWSRAVLHRWSTMDGARWQFKGTLQMVRHLRSMGSSFPRTSKWAMLKDLWIGIKLWFLSGIIVALRLQY